jgi:hypothetical protein
MKKFLIPGMIALLSAACSTDEYPGEDSTLAADSALNGDTRYIAFQLVTPSAASRADADDYADGEAYESAVKAEDITFYFFDANGNPCAINNGLSYTTGNELSTTEPTWSAEGTGADVTTVSSTIVVLRNAAELPRRVVAVLNSYLPEKKNYTLSELASTLLTQAYTAADATVSGSTPSKFMMTNAVYLTADGSQVMNYTPITMANVATTVDDAKQKAVSIYVERVAAKVGVDQAQTFTLTDQKDGEGNQLYVKFLGWTTFDEAPFSFTMKDVTGSMTATNASGVTENATGTLFYSPSTDAAFSGWNLPGKCRSLWAYAYFHGYEMARRTLSYNDISTPLGTGNYAYPLENTSAAVSTSNGLATKVILAAKLYNDAACTQAATVCECMGARYTLAGMKAFVASMLKGRIYIYNSTTQAFTDIDADHLAFSAVDGDYHVKVSVTYSDDESLCSQESRYSLMTPSECEALLATLPNIKIWNGGMCYYYTYINHLNGKPAIVRNHWYTVTINSVTGLGTPVYDPDNTFDPTRPSEEEWVLGADIHIEAWRIQSITLNVTSTKNSDDEHETYLDEHPDLTPKPDTGSGGSSGWPELELP